METAPIATLTTTDPSTSTMIEVEISDTQSHLAVDPSFIEGLVQRVLIRESVDCASVSIALVDDASIRTINRRHLAHDWPTDVITFLLSEPEDRVLAAELVVSAEMAASTAKDVGVDPRAELALYLVHGLLHLLGFNDDTLEAADAMRRREGEILALEGLINTFPLVEASSLETEGREMMSWPR